MFLIGPGQMATVLLSVPSIKVVCLVFLVPFGKGCWRCMSPAWDAVAFLVKKRDGHEMIAPPLSSFSNMEIPVLVSCCPGGSLDCLQEEFKTGNNLLVLSFSTEFCCLYSKQRPNFLYLVECPGCWTIL